MNQEREFATVRSQHGMVVCPHYLASQAGIQTLQQGGNAVDAAIAVQAALGVVYPHMTGLGGDAFWLIYDAKTRSLQGLNGSGRAAEKATQTFYTKQGYAEIPQRGPLSAITIPGAVDSWHQAHQRGGRLSWQALLRPAIALAEEGYPVTGSQVHWTRRDQPFLQQHTPMPCPFLPQDAVPTPGTILKNPDLAQTLRTLAAEGAAAFYQGAIAAQIVDHLSSIGGLLTATDFANHHADWVEPIQVTYRGYSVAELPPNSQGFTVLQMLNLIEPFDLQQIGHGTVDYYHLLVEVTKLAFADRDRWLSDPDFVKIPTAKLISKAYGDRCRSQLQWEKAGSYQAENMGGDTVYTAVTDSEGNAVSVIQSLYFDFGSTVVVPGTGFALQNRGSSFFLDSEHARCLAPYKRPFHTLMPAMVLHPDGKLHYVLGTMGGEGQPQTQLALLTRTLDFGFHPQEAINQPRWLWGRTWGEAVTGLLLEGRITPEVRQGLIDRGHPVTVAPDWTEKMGHAHMIRYCPGTREYQGGCDPRSDGAAIGL
ncbi:MAG: gamma-glutamyltransferase [Cyanobacteria bacterium J06626_18]